MPVYSGRMPTPRSMYCAPKNKVLVSADFDKQELRLRAIIMKDLVLQAHLDAGNVYNLNAIEWFGLAPGTNVKKEKLAAYTAAKIIHLLSQYGGGPETVYPEALKEMRSFKWATCLALSRGFRKTYHLTVKWWAEEFDRVCSLGYSEGRILGFRQYYPRQPEEKDGPTINNRPIQTSAAEMMTLAQTMIFEELDVNPDGNSRALPGAAMIDQRHDSLTLECFEKDAADVKQLLTLAFTQPMQVDGVTYSFPCEIKQGRYFDEV